MTTTTERMAIDIPYPESSDATLQLRLGPCRLRVTATDGPSWIAGTYDDPTGSLPVQVHTGPITTISQRVELSSFGALDLPRLEIAISRRRPFALDIQAGASDTAFDLGGLPISRLSVKTGAGTFEIDFSEPNPGAMSLLELGAGAGALTARNVANANFSAFRLASGVAACMIDFGGTLRRDASARIDAGVGSVDLFIPASTAATVVAKAFASAKRATGAFTVRGEAYYTPAAIAAQQPRLEIEVSLALGALNLATT